jgi:hypothetical protein
MLRSLLDDYIQFVYRKSTPDGLIEIQRSVDYDTATVLHQSPQFLGQLPVLDYLHSVRMPVLRASGELELLCPG